MRLRELGTVLEEIRQREQFRQVRDLRLVTATRGLDRQGREYLVFHSNDYLGMTHEPLVQRAAREALAWGTGSGGARLTSGAPFELSELEGALASFKHTEDAVIFGTGYMTNLGVLYGLCGREDVIFSDALNHASIIDGCRIARARVVVYPHGDLEALERLLQKTECPGQRFVVTDSVFSMDGDVADLSGLLRLRDKYGACLITDDAHGVGVIGKTGRGLAEYWGCPGADIQVGTLSKALGAEGGYAAASREICDALRNLSRPFIFSTALGPATGAAALKALELLQAAPKRYVGRLQENARYMREKLAAAGLPVLPGETPILPVVLGDEGRTLAFAKACQEAGLLLSAIRPPTVAPGSSRIRLTVTAAHSREELDWAAEVMGREYMQI
jgi:8-amino-7-oxononanoate synthase